IRTVDLIEEEAAAIEFEVAVAIIQIPYLPCSAVAPAINFSVEYKAGTDAGTQRHADDIPIRSSFPMTVLTEGEAISVVFHGDGHTEFGFEDSLQLYAFPCRNSYDVVDDALCGVYKGGDRDTNGFDLVGDQRSDAIFELLQGALQGVFIPECHLLEAF